MQLELYREDLRPEFKDIGCSATAFEHFNEAAQQSIILAGRATFRDSNSYNAIYPPVAKQQTSEQWATEQFSHMPIKKPVQRLPGD